MDGIDSGDKLTEVETLKLQRGSLFLSCTHYDFANSFMVIVVRGLTVNEVLL